MRKIKNTIPSIGQEILNNIPDKIARKIILHIGYKYYHIFAYMNAIIRNIPNYITLSNLCCGALSIIFTFNNQLDLAALLIFTGVALDFFDGFFARIFKSR